MSNYILTLKNVSSGYISNIPVVNNFTIDIERNKVTLLVGPNGAGKSTLLRTIFGLMRFATGYIEFDNVVISSLAPWKRFDLGIGFVMQGRSNFPYMSVKENLEIGTYKLNLGKSKAAIEKMCELFPVLKKRWLTLAGNLSGGEQQLLEMAMVIESDPRLLLIDEPSLGLSPKWQLTVFEQIQMMSEMGVTIIMVEQNVRSGLSIAHTAVIMQQGRKVMEVEAQQLLNDNTLKEAYLGSGEDFTSRSTVVTPNVST